MIFIKSKFSEFFIEHHHWYYPDDVVSNISFEKEVAPIYFMDKENPDDVQDNLCFRYIKDQNKVETNYFVGVDWIPGTGRAIYVQPKLNNQRSQQTDYLRMLFSAIKHPEVARKINNLFEIKWKAKPIEIEQKQDLLTPLLIVQFLGIVESIVRKGLKKSYYRVEQNLYSKVKGKVIVAKTVKQNLVKNKTLYTVCCYDEFGFNGLENRLLKKALTFTRNYLPNMKQVYAQEYINSVFSYINPAFEFVSEDVSLHDVKHTIPNVFYKDYEEAIRLAKLILQRFGYNITNAKPQDKILTPPFWIDMAKLFEYYILGLLFDSYGAKEIDFQFHGKSVYLDFLLKKEELIIDAKYKPKYKGSVVLNDIRQLSGYARDEKVYNALGIFDKNDQIKKVLPCLIVYPDSNYFLSKSEQFVLDLGNKEEIQGFINFFKYKVKLPVI